MFVDDRNQMTTSMWHSSILPVKVNVVYAERNRAIGLKGWNSHKSPLHHYAEKKTTKAMNFENFKFEIPSRTKSTFITAFSPDNSLIASCHGDHQIHIFDTKTRKLLKSLAGHERTPWCVTFHPGSNEILASGSLNGKVTVWDLRGDGSESWVVSSNSSVAVASLSFHPYDHVLAIAAGNEIYFWDWSRPKPFASVKTNSESEKVRLVRFDPWGHNILTGVANAEEEDDETTDEPTFDHWSWLLPISRSWHTRSSEHRMLPRYRNRRRLHGNMNSSSRDLPPSYPERPEVESVHTSENRRLGTRLSDLMHRRRRPITGNRENHSRNRNNSSTDSDDEPLEEFIRRRRARLSTAATATERENENDDSFSSSRSHLAQAHQRILHAQVSVNAEIQQQYNRLQQLRQERYRLEMRLRDLQNSANEVRYSTPSLEISFPTSESMDSMLQQSSTSNPEGSCPNPSSEISTATSLSSLNITVASSSPAVSVPQPVPPPVSTYPRPYTCIFRQRQAASTASTGSTGSQQDTTPESFLTGLFETTEDVMVNNEEVAVASSSANQETSSELMDISLPNVEMSVTYGNNSGSRDGRTRERFIDFMSNAEGSEFQRTLSNTIQSSLLENTESIPVSSRSDSNQRNSWRELNPSWESEMFGLDEAHNYALPSIDRIMTRTESNMEEFSSFPSPPFIRVINPPRYSSMFPDTTTSSSDSNLTRAPTITISLPDPVPFPLSVTSSPGSLPLFSFATSQNTIPTPFLSSISSSQTWLLPRNQETVQSSPSVATSQPAESSEQSSDPVQFPPAPTTSISSAESLSRAVDYLMQATDSLSQTADSLLQEASNSASYLLEEGNDQSLDELVDWNAATSRSETVVTSSGSTDLSNNNTTSPGAISIPLQTVNPDATSSFSRLSHQSSAGSGRPSTVVYSTLGRRTSILQTTRPTVISSMDPTVERLLNDPALDEIQTNMQTDTRQEQQQVVQDIQTDNQHQSQPIRPRIDPILSLGELASRNVSSARSSRPRRPRRMYTFRRDILPLEIQGNNLENEESGSRRTLGYIGRRDNITSSSAASGNSFRGEVGGRDLPRNLSRVYNESIPTPPTMRPQPRGVYNVLRQHQNVLRQHQRTISRLNRRHMRSNINRIISSVYADNNGHRAVALNIENTTYRLQCWDFSQLKLPEISRSDINVIVPHCKIYNDASIDISKDGSLLATFVPTFVGYPDNMINVGIFSLEKETFGQLLFKKSYGPNATCLSISPLNNFVCVGLKSRQFLLGDGRPTSYLMAQVLKLQDTISEMPVVRHIYHPAQETQRVVSINTMSWVPEVGRGVVYGTNVGDLRMCLPSWGTEVQASRGMSDYEM